MSPKTGPRKPQRSPRAGADPIRAPGLEPSAADATDRHAGRWSLAAMSPRLFEPVDVAGLAVYRVAFGVLMLIHMLGYLFKGWLETHYLSPVFEFSYPGFEWLPRLPDAAIPTLFWLLAGLSAAIALGIASRVACALFALGFSYVLLLDAASYQNHLYLICLLAAVLAIVPVHRRLSIT